VTAGALRTILREDDRYVLVPLHDGTTVIVRSIAPEDAPLLRRFHATLSEDTVRNRFLSAKPQLSRSDTRYLCNVDGQDHVAVVALDPQRPEVILGVARWVRYPDEPARAEAAFVVADRAQGTGLGSALAITLADLAVERGVEELTGSMLSGNLQSEGLFRRMGGDITVRRQGITNDVTTTLPPHTGRVERLVHRRRMRPGRRTTVVRARPRSTAHAA
jgi:GNAT superfamily N-acetyltransferase